MNREVIFRGKSLEDGKWIYGDLCHNFNGGMSIMPKAFFACRIPTGEEDNDGEDVFHENGLAIGSFIDVDPKTVGQFSGLKDKNGNDIYKGDIYRESYRFFGEPIKDTKELEVIEGERVGQVIFKNGAFCFHHVNEHGGGSTLVGGFEDDYHFESGEKHEYEIIGNIHENPELLNSK